MQNTLYTTQQRDGRVSLILSNESLSFMRRELHFSIKVAGWEGWEKGDDIWAVGGGECVGTLRC